MFSLNDSLSYYLYSRPADMRKGFDTLCGLVRSEMGRNPLSGEVFIFINGARATIKLLRWERGGWFCIINGWKVAGLSFPGIIPRTKVTP